MERRHDMSSMSGMDGMDGMSANAWQSTNMGLARAFWYIIASIVALCLLFRGIDRIQNSMRLKTLRTKSVAYPTKPQNAPLQAWATITAICRESSYPQWHIPTRGLQWLTPPPMGRVLLLLAYWSVIIYMMTSDAIRKDVSYWERIGFRNAWISVTQVPLLYMLALKTNIAGLISGVSYERLNWIHRWVARTLFVTATVHGWHFYQQWVIADIVDWQMEMMPMTVYGMGAWGVLLWFFITSLKPFRNMAYEIFVIQHIIGAVLFLWLLYVHVPAYAVYNIWFAIALLVLDRVVRGAMFIWQNTKANPIKSRCSGAQRWGHRAQLAVVGDSTTVVTIKDVHFKWKPGQHLYLWMPKIGPVDVHPYTIACPHRVPKTCICNSIQLVIKAHSGFSKRLHRYARKALDAQKSTSVTAFVIGPFGNPPRWDVYETMVLVSASTGTSFTLPILENVLKAAEVAGTTCTKRIDFLLAARQGEELGFYIGRLNEAVEQARAVGIELNVHVAITGEGQLSTFSGISSPEAATSSESVEKPSQTTASCCKHARNDSSSSESDEMTPALQSRRRNIGSNGEIAAADSAQPKSCCHENEKNTRTITMENADIVQMTYSSSRPDIKKFIRSAVEATGGETSAVVCGGQSLVAATRNSVASLSDERAVHKGTGAQGIHLHVEEYCF